MNTVGLIVEYNPLHNGHVHHFNEAKRLTRADAVVAVMSGDFLQRGEPAVVDKWARTEMALAMGADLVLELPVAYAVQPAEWFAYGAVSLLAATGVVTHLCFGTEAGDSAQLAAMAELLAHESRELKERLAAELAGGASYPAAFAAAAEGLAAGRLGAPAAAGARAGLLQPNNTLGLHYLIALRRLGSAIEPVSIPRQSAGYHDTEPGQGGIASATAIRRLLLAGGEAAGGVQNSSIRNSSVLNSDMQDISIQSSSTRNNSTQSSSVWNNNEPNSNPIGGLDGRMQDKPEAYLARLDAVRPYIPEYTADVLAREFAAGRGPVTWDNFRAPLFHKLLQLSAEELSGLHEVTEGLEHRIRRVLPELPAPTPEALLEALKTKRYTRVKLQRMLVHILLGHAKAEMAPDALGQGPDHIRVLGFSDRGQTLLSMMKHSARLPVVVKTPGQPYERLAQDIKAASLYANALPGAGTDDLFRDYKQPPVRFVKRRV